MSVCMAASMAVLPKAASPLCSQDSPFLKLIPSSHNNSIFFRSYSSSPFPLLSMRHEYFCAGRLQASIPRSRVQALNSSSKSNDSTICCFSLQAGIATAVDDAPLKLSSTNHEIPIENRFPTYPTVLDINQIRDILPHRFPFLLVDRIIEYSPGVSAVGIKNVTINDNFFPGHFPDRPIMPGVLMVEAMAQVAGILMLQPDIGGSKENFFFAGVDKIRFRKPVIAGDTLVMRMDLIKLQKRFGLAKMYGKAYVGGEVVCEGEFLLSLGSD